MHQPHFDTAGKRLLAPTAAGFLIADTAADTILAEEKSQAHFVEGAHFIAGRNKVAMRLAPMLGQVRIYDASTGRFEQRLNSFTCQTGPGGRWVLGETVERDSRPAIWDLVTGERVQTLTGRAAGSLAPIYMSPDGTLVLIESELRVTSVWRLREPKRVTGP